MRYFYNVSDNKVVCVSHYAGKPVRGIAKCDPSDEFDAETGRKLSQKRCDVKIAEKRLARATERLEDAVAQLNAARDLVNRMTAYRTDSLIQLNDLKADLTAFEDLLR